MEHIHELEKALSAAIEREDRLKKALDMTTRFMCDLCLGEDCQKCHQKKLVAETLKEK